MEKATPLVNSSMLQQHKQETVQLVGRVERTTPQAIMLKTSDQGIVEVVVSNTSAAPDSQYVAIVGRVDEHGERVREFRTISLGDSLGM
jgi:cobalamin biosynthesis Co2+ chelatase CbiK